VQTANKKAGKVTEPWKPAEVQLTSCLPLC